MKLHEYHARSLEATLSRADDAVSRMLLLLKNAGQDGVVRKIEDTLSPESRAALAAGVDTLQKMLAEVADTFSLEAHSLDIARVMDAELSTLRVLFENCRPTRMKGYGQEFSLEAREELNQMMDKLIAHVCEMRTHIG
jgi:hypothetical protein